ncbi:MAG: glycosyltransferase [Agathobacter sp.]|nr:glycosyltransferase [Agathobacter sp.]
MIKVLQISNYQYPHIGGIEQVARDIADSLINRDDIEQKIICFNEEAEDGEYVCHRNETVCENVKGVEVIRCGCIAKVASQSLSFTFGKELKKVLTEFAPDIVIFHYPNPYQAAFLLPLLKERTRLILYWHLDIIKQKILGKIFHGQTIKLLQRADKIVATSPNYIDGSKYLSQFRGKCMVIPNCIQPERLLPDEYTVEKVKKIKEQYSGKTICFAVGRHVPYKGMEYLIRASKLLGDNFAILIGGKGPLTEELKKLAASDKKVEFLGRVSDSDLIAYYEACDIFAFPSITKNEAFGIALAEGMYFGRPAVTFTIPGSGVNYVNLADETGLECPNGDEKAYAKALVKLDEDDGLRKKLGESARKRVEELFMFDQLKTKINELIDSESIKRR